MLIIYLGREKTIFCKVSESIFANFNFNNQGVVLFTLNLNFTSLCYRLAFGQISCFFLVKAAGPCFPLSGRICKFYATIFDHWSLANHTLLSCAAVAVFLYSIVSGRTVWTASLIKRCRRIWRRRSVIKICQMMKDDEI